MNSMPRVLMSKMLKISMILLERTFSFSPNMTRIKFLLKYLNKVRDYNSTDSMQANWYIERDCANYTSCFLKSQGWNVISNREDTTSTYVASNIILIKGKVLKP